MLLNVLSIFFQQTVNTIISLQRFQKLIFLHLFTNLFCKDISPLFKISVRFVNAEKSLWRFISLLVICGDKYPRSYPVKTDTQAHIL